MSIPIEVIEQAEKNSDVWCKNCGEQIILTLGWHHKLSQKEICFQPARLMAEPDRDRSSDEK